MSFQQQQDQRSRVYFEDFKSGEYFKKGQAAEEKKQWALAIDQYTRVLDLIEKNPGEVYRIDSNRWVGAAEHVLRRVSEFPKEGLEIYRNRFESDATHKLRLARRSRDLKGYEKIISRFFFTRAAEEALLELTQRYYDSGRIDEAIYFWSRYLRYYYRDPSVPPSIIMAKLAHAYALMRNPVGVGLVRGWASDRKLLAERVNIGTGPVALDDFLNKLDSTASIDLASENAGGRPPVIDRGLHRTEGVYSNDIKMWSRDLKMARTVKRAGWDDWSGRQVVVDVSQAILPLYTRVQEMEYLVFQNGFKVMALDPSTPDGRIYWMNPEGGDEEEGSATVNLSIRYGCAIYQDLVIANMFSKKAAQRSGQAQVKTLRAFSIGKGERKWSSEDRMGDHDLAFSSVPVVSDDRVYVAAVKEPQPNAGGFPAQAEQEVYLFCFKARTGELLWKSFLCSSTLSNTQFQRYLAEGPQISATAGVVYCQTNVGALVAVDGSTGQILWAVEYEARRDLFQQVRSAIAVSSTPPILNRGVVYCLPADGASIIGVNKDTGDLLETYAIQPDQGGKPWKGYLLCVQDDLLVAVTSQNIHFLKGPRTSGAKLESPLIQSSYSQSGLGALQGDYLFIPTSHELLMFSISQDFMLKSLEATWDKEGASGGGNIVLGGRYLFCSGTRLSAYIDARVLYEDYEVRLKHDPVDPQALLKYGELMYENAYPYERGRGESQEDILLKAATSLADYVRMAGTTIPADQLSQIRNKIYNAYMALSKRNESDWDRMARYSAEAKHFSGTMDQKALSTYRLARALAGLSRFSESVEQYQEIITQYRNTLLIQDEPEAGKSYYPFTTLAVQAIHDLIRDRGFQLYARYEEEAARMFDRISGKDVSEYFALAETYPHSRSAEKALRKAMEYGKDRNRWGQVVSTLERMNILNPSLDQNPAHHFEMADALERLEDYERMERLLKDVKDRLGDKDVEGVKAAAMVERRLKDVQARKKAHPELKEPLKLLGKMDSASGTREKIPLIPEEPYPSIFNRDWEMLRNGSTVELWDMRHQKKIWSQPYPGAYLGIRYEISDRVWIKDVNLGSPAEQSGLEAGMEILRIDGQAVTSSNLFSVLEKLVPEKPSRWEISRGLKSETLTVTASAYPESSGPGVLGVLPTRDYGIAVVWEDAVASLDGWTGQVRWIHRDVRWQGRISTFGSQRGKIVFCEGKRYSANSSWHNKPDDSTEVRLVCLDDVTGQVAWMRTMNYDDRFSHLFPNGQIPLVLTHSSSPHFLLGSMSQAPSPAGSTQLPRRQPEIVRESGASLNPQLTFVRIDVEKGVEAGTRTSYPIIGSRPFIMNWDRDNGRLYLISSSLQMTRRLDCLDVKQDDRLLRYSVNLPAGFNAAANIPMSIGKSYVCLMNSQEGILLYGTTDHSSPMKVPLPEGRMIANQDVQDQPRSACVWLSKDTLLAVLAPKVKVSQTMAFAVAIDVSSREPKVLWEGPAPRSEGAPVFLNADHKNYVSLYTSRGVEPGADTAGSLGVVYGIESGGYVVKFASDLLTLSESGMSAGRVLPVMAHRDFIYLLTRQGIEVYGN